MRGFLRLPYKIENSLSYIEIDGEIDLKWQAIHRYIEFLSDNPLSSMTYHLNNWGTLTWKEAFALRYIINLANELKSDYFLNVALKHVDAILSNTDISRGIVDYRGMSTYGWSSTRYSMDKVSKMRHLVGDSIIGDELIHFIQIYSVIKKKVPPNIYKIVEVVIGIYSANQKDYTHFKNDKLKITKEGEGYYRFPYGSPIWCDGVNVPFNYLSQYTIFLLSLYEVTHDDIYIAEAVSLGKILKRHLLNTNSTYLWNYWWGKGYSGWNDKENLSLNTPWNKGSRQYASKGYATIDALSMIKMFSYGLVFTLKDIDILANTFLNNSAIIQFSKYPLGVQLAKYDSRIERVLRQSLERFLDIPIFDLPLLIPLTKENKSSLHFVEVSLSKNIMNKVSLPSNVVYLSFGKSVNVVGYDERKGYYMRNQSIQEKKRKTCNGGSELPQNLCYRRVPKKS